MRHVAATATLGEGTELGLFCVVGENVHVGARCVLGHHVVLHPGTWIGDEVRIDDHAVIGKQPMRAANSATTREQTLPPARVGSRCIVGSSAVIYAGAVLGERVLVADLATIREDVTVGEGTIVGRGVAVENRCTVGRFCKLETNAYVTAYSTLEDRVFLAPGVVTTNDNFVGRTKERFQHFRGVTVRKGGRIGANATVLPGKVVGADALVAAGAVVTRDAAPGQVSVGAPARAVRVVPREQLLEEQGWEP